MGRGPPGLGHARDESFCFIARRFRSSWVMLWGGVFLIGTRAAPDCLSKGSEINHGGRKLLLDFCTACTNRGCKWSVGSSDKMGL